MELLPVRKDLLSIEYTCLLISFCSVIQGDLEDIAELFLDAKASARLLQEQPDKYVSQ